MVLMSHRMVALHYIPNVNGHAYSYPLPSLWRWGLNLDLNDMERDIIHLSVPENYGFHTIICDYFYKSPFITPTFYSSQCSRKLFVSTLQSVNIFTGRPSFMGARRVRKRHHEYNYSYHRVLNSKILIRH